MTDHRVTDLSYGQLGKATYDVEENDWKFSVDFEKKCSIQQLVPFKQWLPPSIRDMPSTNETPSLILKSQRKWLEKARPETFPADILASSLAKADASQQSEAKAHFGSLLAVGCAVDPDRVSGSRTPEIIAVPHGDGGHILCLIKSRVQRRGWGKHSAARLALLDSESPEYSYWVGDGGAIRQIMVAEEENGSGTWLAVRQATATTIFRPQYGRLHDASTISNGFPEKFPASQLNPNLVATLTAEQTQSQTHTDVAFNPWYARQFAVVDTLGIWSIWDLDRPHGKSSTLILVPGSRGGVYDCYEPDPTRKAPDPGHSDGWYKITWACNISTIVVSNRRHLAVVDLKTQSSRVHGENILLSNSQDWILDVKRSATSYDKLFILTTSRIFWVQVVPGGVGEEGDHENTSELKILLSYRHFRNADDETMRLVMLNNDNVSVLIISSISPVVQTYCFREDMGPSGIPSSCQSSFRWYSGETKSDSVVSTQNAWFLPCPLLPHTSLASSGPSLQYLEKDVKFFQVWTLGAKLELSSTLCAVQNNPSETISQSLSITAPNWRVRQSSRRFGPRIIDDSFIVPDGVEEEYELDRIRGENIQHDMQAMLLHEWKDLRFRINWRKVYRYAFALDSEDARPAPEDTPTMEEFLARVSDRIHHGLEDSELAMTTLIEASGLHTIAEDIEEASLALRQFLQSLESDPVSDATTKLAVSNLGIPAEHQNAEAEPPKYPDLSGVYDQIAEYWMASLPPNLSNIARVSRYKVIHQLSIDVCLSSIGISVENKLVSAADMSKEKDNESMSLPALEKDSRLSMESPPALFSSQFAAIPDGEPDFRLPTLGKTPSVHSHVTSASEIKEDPAIARLRQYAISIKAKPDLGPPSLLSHWPSKPGADPAQYSYEEAQRAAAAAAAESGDESEHRNRKEEARRRRRTERFLRQERSRAVEAAAQSMFLPSGSQPTVSHHAVSSQTADDLPMTQPELGIFGSRSAQKGKRKVKKPRTAGFR